MQRRHKPLYYGGNQAGNDQHNTISGANDIDGIVDYFGERLEEMMVVAAEGGHD